jgi:O-methyltransferase involved in polyketide biosynthesis
LVFLACPGRLRQIRLAIHAGLDGDPPIRIIDRRYHAAAPRGPIEQLVILGAGYDMRGVRLAPDAMARDGWRVTDIADSEELQRRYIRDGRVVYPANFVVHAVV